MNYSWNTSEDKLLPQTQLLNLRSSFKSLADGLKTIAETFSNSNRQIDWTKLLKFFKILIGKSSSSRQRSKPRLKEYMNISQRKGLKWTTSREMLKLKIERRKFIPFNTAIFRSWLFNLRQPRMVLR